MAMERYEGVGVVGSGAMGSGIAQIAATKGHRVYLYDAEAEALSSAKKKLDKILERQVEKERMSREEVDGVWERLHFVDDLSDLAASDLVVEAVIEDLDVKKKLFQDLEKHVKKDAVLATNTSSLSIASVASACEHPERVLGAHFFNPAPLMPLVEVVPSVLSDHSIVQDLKKLLDEWGKVTALAKDTPGFIVNRVARPFYGEALRILEEGEADVPTIDWAMTEIGGFRMGPFTLMDFIGNDVNFKVTWTVFTEFFYEPRYRPSITQKRLYEAGLYGKKSGRGYYDHSEGAENPAPNKDEGKGNAILERILVMLINEAVDALFLNIASRDDLDLAMTKGVNYPKGLLAWCDEKGPDRVLKKLEEMQELYGEERYRPSPLLKKMVREGETFY